MFKSSLLLLIIVAGLVLRILGMHGDLWLDEIWSLRLVSELKAPLDIFFLHHDNNHLINSIWLIIIGSNAPFWIYRLLSVVCSTITVVLVGIWSPLILNRVGAKLLTIFISFSYVLVLYGSEARGYAPMLLCGVLTLWSQYKYRRNGELGSALAFWFASVLGVFSHLSFIHIYLSLLITHLLWISREANLKRFLILHIPSALMMVGFSAWWVHDLVIGGGTIHTSWDTFFSGFSVGFGGGELSAQAPSLAAFYWALAVVVYILACFECVRLRKDFPELGLVLISLLVIVPALFVWAMSPKFVMVRYLLPTICAALVAISSFLARMWERDLIGKILAIAFVASVLVGNFTNTSDLIRYGRGEYRSAVNYIRGHTSGYQTVIGAAQDFRVRTTLEFYSTAGLAPEMQVTKLQDPSQVVDWVIRSNNESINISPSCHKAAQFYSSPLSGFTWEIFCCSSRCFGSV